mgnify:CR=1 FL=1
MNRCLELASKGLENVSPNPMVGSVIVYEGKIIGEGYHMEYGKEHAEARASTLRIGRDIAANLLAEIRAFLEDHP